jgi:hypothetical protein
LGKLPGCRTDTFVNTLLITGLGDKGSARDCELVNTPELPEFQRLHLQSGLMVPLTSVVVRMTEEIPFVNYY